MNPDSQPVAQGRRSDLHEYWQIYISRVRTLEFVDSESCVEYLQQSLTDEFTDLLAENAAPALINIIIIICCWELLCVVHPWQCNPKFTNPAEPQNRHSGFKQRIHVACHQSWVPNISNKTKWLQARFSGRSAESSILMSVRNNREKFFLGYD
ncbi:hypothetical protein PILCRDRAFT_558288 [Piloderma croceum F 1598]|uniref:Uncharacterized protein n=1 Tax=Piloderma croceum (strain F 1598) TaxID=765440 RepID=A0A0C3BQ95_PILCF|nr:hypothetical protein PILCRDRAFT_558288 [Piloderma croceum F 1598]